MFSFKVEKTGKTLDNIMASIRKLDEHSTDIGHFASQGKHTGSDGISDYSYVALGQALATGYFPVQGVSRGPMPYLKQINENSMLSMTKQNSQVTRQFQRWAKRMHKPNNSPQQLLSAVGQHVVAESRKVFGNPMYFPLARAGNDRPLITTGEFASKFTYRTSLDKKVRR